MFEQIQELYSVLSTDLGLGIIVVAVIITIGLAFYGARRMDEN